jgi:hypothetical protein
MACVGSQAHLPVRTAQSSEHMWLGTGLPNFKLQCGSMSKAMGNQV